MSQCRLRDWLPIVAGLLALYITAHASTASAYPLLKLSLEAATVPPMMHNTTSTALSQPLQQQQARSLLATGRCANIAGIYNFNYVSRSTTCPSFCDDGSKFTVNADCTWNNIGGPGCYCRGTYDPATHKWVADPCHWYNLWGEKKDPKVYTGIGRADAAAKSWDINWSFPKPDKCDYKQTNTKSSTAPASVAPKDLEDGEQCTAHGQCKTGVCYRKKCGAAPMDEISCKGFTALHKTWINGPPTIACKAFRAQCETPWNLQYDNTEWGASGLLDMVGVDTKADQHCKKRWDCTYRATFEAVRKSLDPAYLKKALFFTMGRDEAQARTERDFSLVYGPVLSCATYKPAVAQGIILSLMCHMADGYPQVYEAYTSFANRLKQLGDDVDDINKILQKAGVDQELGKPELPWWLDATFQLTFSAIDKGHNSIAKAWNEKGLRANLALMPNCK